MTTQLVALVLIAFTDGGGVATSQKLGEFYDMGACEKAAKAARLVGGEDVHVRFACVPLTPVSSSTLTPRP